LKKGAFAPFFYIKGSLILAQMTK